MNEIELGKGAAFGFLVFCPLVDFLMKPVDALFAQGVTTFLQLVIVTTKT